VSGFLRNLSAQALGRGAPVRSVARLPYAALPATPESPAGERTSSLLAAAQFASVASPPDAADRTARSESQQHEASNAPLFAHVMCEPADPNMAAPGRIQPAESAGAAPVLTPPILVPTPTRFIPPPAFAITADAGTTGDAHRLFSAEATEVHVSIGRIELTAVHEASPLARRAAPVKPSLPLHEYLARRQRGPS
jgi:hypothetical protein